MANYSINKGIGKQTEFKGLKSQYLFIFAGGLLSDFILFVIMYLAGINQWICIGFGVIAAGVIVYGTFYLNSKYGGHGLMKMLASKSHPRFILSRLPVAKLFTFKKKQ